MNFYEYALIKTAASVGKPPYNQNPADGNTGVARNSDWVTGFGVGSRSAANFQPKQGRNYNSSALNPKSYETGYGFDNNVVGRAVNQYNNFVNPKRNNNNGIAVGRSSDNIRKNGYQPVASASWEF